MGAACHVQVLASFHEGLLEACQQRDESEAEDTAGNCLCGSKERERCLCALSPSQG